MIINPLRCISNRSAVVLILPFLLAGCFFNLGEHKDFSSWYYGDPGMAGALGEAQCDRYADRIQEERHRYYLHFRTPEVLLQPQGGKDYPERLTAEGRQGQTADGVQTCDRAPRGWETFRFDTVDAGLVDTVIPYRKDTAINDRGRGWGQKSLAYAEGLAYNTGLSAVMKAPIYIVHDILKTLYIPVAGTYYLIKPEAAPEDAADVIQVQDTSTPDKAPTIAVVPGDLPTASETEDAPQASRPAEESAVSPAGEEDGQKGMTTAGESPPMVGENDRVVLPPREETPATPVTPEPATAADDEAAVSVAADQTAEGRGEGSAVDEAAIPADDAESAAGSGPMATGTRAPSDETDTRPQAADTMDAPATTTPAPNGTQEAPRLMSDEAPASSIASSAEKPDTDAEVMTPTTAGADGAQDASVPAAETLEREGDVSAGAADASQGADGEPLAVDRPEAFADEKPPMAEAPGADVVADPAAAAASASREASDTSAAAPAAPRTTAEASLAADGVNADQTDDVEARLGAADEMPQKAEAPATELVADPGSDAASVPGEAPDTSATAPAAPRPTAGASLAADRVDADQTDDVEAQLGVVDHADKVATAAAALAASARRGIGPEPAASDADPTGAPATGAESDAPLSPQGGTSAEIVEEDLLATEVATDRRPEDQVPDADPEHAGESERTAPVEASVPVASVTPERKASPAEAPPAPESVDWVRIKKHKLQKKAAFIGFFSRSAGVDQTTKDYLDTHVWPVFKDRCDDNLTLLRQGDEGYPAALDSLVRDQFGRLNSFELTTVARFSGLNAIVAATIIDIRVASAISGILWYKSPEGQLRMTLLVEVFDAETGTKLLDRTYIREEEVEELEPGADEALRPEDRPVLQAILRDVAEDMGEHVCDTLDDLPWRAYVSGISGQRVSLSAGESAGLVPGNILKVFNSQIVDGLNNQQFFLTGEKVGRIQIIEVFPNRSEAWLIEGQGLRDYSVAIP